MASASSVHNTNRLASEKSPYLLQHASNPVDWYPWGDEAFRKAKELNKLIFLSVGYSTCHWCHVMEKESFENKDIASIMNKHYVNIKVDREERPDVDKMYMSFVNASSGHGGWPMSVFLMPNLIPVAGGTYFPPHDMHGRVGFSNLLKTLAEKWKEDKNKFEFSAEHILEILNKNAAVKSTSSEIPSEETFSKCYKQLSIAYESEYGGFGESPKFPQPSNLSFLFAYRALNPSLEEAGKGFEMATHTLTKMAKGGIHDHISGGFARYSTDAKWHVPHFEKMLYDQAQLISVYIDAFLATKDKFYADIVKDIMDYCIRDLSHPLGGFYSAEDADSLVKDSTSEKKEGAFYVWSLSEVKEILKESVSDGVSLSDVFCYHYSVFEKGNVNPAQDPHDELKGQNVLIEYGSVDETAAKFGLEPDNCKELLEKAKVLLCKEREKRPRPGLDDKIITAWNGMMLTACARAGTILNIDEYVDRAQKLAGFIKDHIWKDGRLLRAVYKTEDGGISSGSCIDGYADDYAHVIHGLCRVYNATLNTDYLKWAGELQDVQNTLFWDNQNGGYFNSQVDESILIRFKDNQDGAEPAINSVSSQNLVRLSRLLNRPDFDKKASKIFTVFYERLHKYPMIFPEMVVGLMMYKSPVEQVIISGDVKLDSVKVMLRAVHSSCLNPARILLIADADSTSCMYRYHEKLKKYAPKSETSEPIAYICTNFSCSLPLKDPTKVHDQIRAKSTTTSK